MLPMKSQQISEQLRTLAKKYCWDMAPEAATDQPDRVILRVMDLGTLDDIFALEALLGRETLAETLQAAPPGWLRPRSWSFWHYRLNLVDALQAPPPMPVRTYA